MIGMNRYIVPFSSAIEAILYAIVSFYSSNGMFGDAGIVTIPGQNHTKITIGIAGAKADAS